MKSYKSQTGETNVVQKMESITPKVRPTEPERRRLQFKEDDTQLHAGKANNTKGSTSSTLSLTEPR